MFIHMSWATPPPQLLYVVYVRILNQETPKECNILLFKNNNLNEVMEKYFVTERARSCSTKWIEPPFFNFFIITQ